MNVRRYVAADMREALRLVQEDLGPEAVVLENRRVAGGVELVATLDHEQALQEHALKMQHRERARRQDQYQDSPHQEPQREIRRPDQEEYLLPSWIREEQRLDFNSEHGQEPVFSRIERPVSAGQSVKAKIPERHVEAVVNGPVQGRRDQQLAGLSQHLQASRQLPANAVAPEVAEVKALRAELELLRTQLRDIQRGAKPSATAPSALSRVQQRLRQIGITEELLDQLMEGLGLDTDAAGMQNEEKLWQTALGRLAKSLRLDTATELVDRQGVIVLLGPTGAGKTTTLAKLAARHVIRHGAAGLALLSTDSYRVGSYEQLQKIAKAMGVSSALVEPGQKLDQVIAGLGSRRLILMDTAGFSRQAPEQMAQQRLLAESRYRLLGQLVLPANLQGSVLQRNYEDFSSFNLSGAMISKIDEATSLGECLSLLATTNLAISYATNGQRIPEDIIVPRAAQLVSQAVAMARQHARPAQRSVTNTTGRMANSSHN